MARISCPLCDKTFRNPSGLSWHVSHIHPPVATANMAMSGALDLLTAEQVSLEGVEPDIGDQADASELSTHLNGLNGLDEKVEEMASAVQETQDHLRELGSRLDVAERSIGGIGAIQAKIGKQREAFTGMRSDVDMIRSVVVSLCRLMWGIDQDHNKDRRGGDQWANHSTDEEVEEAREALRGVLGIYPGFVGRVLAAIQRQNGKPDEYLRILG